MSTEVGAFRPTLYGGLAESLKSLIEGGTFREGQKIPSIRTMSRQYGVSVNTVREAYWILEAQQLLESRPQSGYFVRPRTLVQSSALSSFDLTNHSPHAVVPCSLREDLGAHGGGRGLHGLNLARGAIDTASFPWKRLNATLGALARETDHSVLDYDTMKGMPELREAVARHGLEAGIRLGPDDYMITSGCLPAVFLALQILCRPGDTVAVESPTYSEFLKLFPRLELQVLEIPTHPVEGMNLEVLQWALDRHTVKAVITIANFNNPCGFLMPEARKRTLVKLLETRGIPLIEDDAYGDLSFVEDRPAACKAFDTTGNVLYCSSVSKTLAPGYRVGWITPGKWMEDAVEWKRLTASAAASPMQLAVARFLREANMSRHLRTLRRTLFTQARTLLDIVRSSFPEGTVVHTPLGGIFLWVELPEGHDAEALYHEAIKEGIFFRPGEVFSGSGAFRRQLRLAFGIWSPETEAAAVRLGELACQQAKGLHLG